MRVSELIERLGLLPAGSEVLLEDLNGLWWRLEPDLIRLDPAEGVVVIGVKGLNKS